MSKPDFSGDEQRLIQEVIKSNWWSQGKITEEFELQLSNFLSANTVVVNNGSSALTCSLLSHGIKPGDKVAVPDFTFIATSSVAKILGASVIPIDIEPNTLNMDLNSLEENLKEKSIKFVITVDVAGLPNDIERIMELSKKYKFVLIEDAAEAFGSEYKNKKIGSFAHTTIFSFHIAKQITTVEGGCVSSTNPKIIEKIKSIRNHGRINPSQYTHDSIGSNFRITDIHSAIGLAQIKKIDQYIERRNNIASKFRSQIKNLSFQEIPNYVTKHPYMLFFTMAKDSIQKEKYLKFLGEKGIDVRSSWMPIHMQPCNPELASFNCPKTEKIYETSFTLPIFNSMTNSEIDFIIDSCNQII